MKRRFFECAILLGVVMSVMFLAQTPDGIGHNREDPNTGAPHKPPGHTHNPAAKVDSKGKPVSTGGQDPRGKHYSGNDGIGTENASAWGIRYYPGLYNHSANGPNSDTQNVYSVSVTANASTGERHARVTVTPGVDQIEYLDLTQYPDERATWQGVATGTVTFSPVNYHARKRLSKSGCREVSIKKDTWTETAFLNLIVKKVNIARGDKRTYGGGFSSNVVTLTATSEHSYTASSDEREARGYQFLLQLKAIADGVSKYQDKSATGSGKLNDTEVWSGDVTAAYKWTKWKECYCKSSRTPDEPWLKKF